VQEGIDARPGEGLQVVEVAEHGEHADQQDEGFGGAARQAGARLGDDLLQVNGNLDEHQTGEDPRDPRLGQEEVVPRSIYPSPSWSFGVREV